MKDEMTERLSKASTDVGKGDLVTPAMTYS